jgi:hypothetical protein
MTKTSTVHFTLNNLSSLANEEILNTVSAFDFEDEFADVFEILDYLSEDIRQEIIQKIVNAIPDNE